MGGRLLVEVGAGGPRDEYGRDDNVLMSDEDVDAIIPARHRRDWQEGWSVRFLLDRWEAFAMYGYDAGDTLA